MRLAELLNTVRRSRWRRRVLYRFDRWNHVRRRRRAPVPLIVYTLSKTGSSSVIEAVRLSPEERPIVQVHNLANEWLQVVEAEFRRRAPFDHSLQIRDSHFLRQQPPSTAHPWDVITLVRDPIAQNISSFFQTGERQGYFSSTEQATSSVIQRLIRTFLHAHDQCYGVNWFDEEMYPVLGIDVYQHPFDHAAGYQVLGGDDVRVLLLRNESLDRAPEGLSKFLGVPVHSLPRVNDANAKRYGHLYRPFLEAVRLPRSMVECLYGSSYVRHFYTSKEVDRFVRRWAPNVVAG